MRIDDPSVFADGGRIIVRLVRSGWRMKMFRVSFAATITMALAAFVWSGSPVRAQKSPVTGLDKLHEQARVGGKTCMIDHEHGGEGTLPSRKGASEAAIRHWESFTAWEYGKPWGSYRLAAARKLDCQSGGSGWLCRVTARPCRR
jgi:hypothetical protein